MTLQQLRYITTVADTGTITEAAKKLYISQPSLTNAIHELEKEMGLTIFNRTNKGIFISREGEEFLGYARQVLEQTTILEDKYKKRWRKKAVLRINPALLFCGKCLCGSGEKIRAGGI